MAQQNFRGLEEEINYGPHKKKKIMIALMKNIIAQ